MDGVSGDVDDELVEMETMVRPQSPVHKVLTATNPRQTPISQCQNQYRNELGKLQN